MACVLPVDTECHRNSIFYTSQHPGDIMCLLVEQLIICITVQIREFYGAAFSFLHCCFPLLFLPFPMSCFVFFTAVSFLCLLFFYSNFFLNLRNVLIPLNFWVKFGLFFLSFTIPTYIFFCSHLLFCPCLTPLFVLCYSVWFFMCVYIPIHKPMCSYPHGVCSDMYW